MGGKRGKRNHFAQKKRDKKQNREPAVREDGPYLAIKRENDSFETYYKHQKICKTPEEWEKFLEAIRKDLPSTFRVTGSRREAQYLLSIIKNQFLVEYVKAVKELHATDASEVVLPEALPWYPGNLAWQLDLCRKDIRRSEPLFRLHNFLIAETNSGNISRQESVSMIPPLVLDVKSHHKILDMCAAPGSKTAQIIELLHGDDDSGPLPTGFVVANDIDNKRCYMLVHQAKRLNSPCCMITNMDSAAYPDLQYEVDGKLENLKFDRVLCDVPCSGDGTLRKNPDIWMKWNVHQANGLNGLQYRIVKRGLELLAEGGRLVYSTCSLNPVENEAVLCRILEECAGSVELVDVSEELKDLKHDPGMEYWEPCAKDLKFYKKFDEVPQEWLTIVRPSLFPPEDVKKFHLERCVRVLPHHQNTGGFFVAALHKKSALPWTPPIFLGKKEEEAKNSTEETSSEPPKKKKRFNYGFREDPFVFFDKDEPVYDGIREFYQVKDTFDPVCLLTRCKVGKKKHLYFCTPAVRNVVMNNENTIKIINTGVKTFSRCDNKSMGCDFRLTQEGLANVHQFLGDSRRILISKDDLVHLLKNLDPTNAPQIENVSQDLRDQLNKMDQGSCILNYFDENVSLTMAGWKGVRSVRAYTEVNDAIHTLRLLGADVSQYEKNKFKKDDVVEENLDDKDTVEPIEETALEV